MKRIITLILALLLVVSLEACGKDADSEIKKPADVSVNGTSATEENDESGPVEGQEDETEPTPPPKQEVTIEETVLVDEKGIKITAKKLALDDWFGPEIKLLIENNSGKDLTFQCRDSSINGYMIETMMSVDVVDGKKANDSLTFSSSNLESCGIEEIADMEFAFYAFATEGWDDYFYSPLIQIKTSIADTYEYTFADDGDVAYDDGGVKIVIKGLAEDESVFGPSIVVYIENNSDKDITVQTRDVSINGFMVDAMFSSDVLVGKHAVDTITFMEFDLEENEITEIENVELSFHVFDYEDWGTIVDTDVVEISF